MFLTKYDQGDETKEEERDETCGKKDKEEKNKFKLFVRNIEGKKPI